MDDLIHRLNELGNAEHDDLEICLEAAERIIALTTRVRVLSAALAYIRDDGLSSTKEFTVNLATAALRQEG